MGITSTTDDTLISELIERAEYRIRRVCGKGTGLFASGSRTEKFPGYGVPVLYLTHRPVTAITSVIAYSSSTSSSTLDSTTYRINDEATAVMLWDWTDVAWDVGGPDYSVRGALWRPYTGRDKSAYPYTQVIYTGGYSTIPDDLEDAAVWLTAQLYHGRTIKAGLQSENLGNYGYTRAQGENDAIDNELRERLRDYIIDM